MTEQTSNWYFSSFHVQFFSCTTRQTCFSLSAELLSSPVAAGDWWYAVELAYCGWWWYRRSSSCGGSCCMNWPCGVQVPAATNIHLHLSHFVKTARAISARLAHLQKRWQENIMGSYGHSVSGHGSDSRGSERWGSVDIIINLQVQQKVGNFYDQLSIELHVQEVTLLTQIYFWLVLCLQVIL